MNQLKYNIQATCTMCTQQTSVHSTFEFCPIANSNENSGQK